MSSGNSVRTDPSSVTIATKTKLYNASRYTTRYLMYTDAELAPGQTDISLGRQKGKQREVQPGGFVERGAAPRQSVAHKMGVYDDEVARSVDHVATGLTACGCIVVAGLSLQTRKTHDVARAVP